MDPHTGKPQGSADVLAREVFHMRMLHVVLREGCAVEFLTVQSWHASIIL